MGSQDAAASETALVGGAAHGLGERLRRLRNANGLSLRQLAEAVGTSASFLSQLERGLTGASTSTLMRIADCYGTSITELFAVAGGARSPVLRRADRPVLPLVEGQRKTLLSRPPLTHFEVYVLEFEPGGSTGPDAYTHGDASEMLLVLAGTVELELGAERHRLAAGDSIEYSTATPHRVANVGHDRAEALFVISPPTSTAENLVAFRARPSAAQGPAPTAVSIPATAGSGRRTASNPGR